MPQKTMYGEFESASIARRSDPESSKAAAREITANGTRAAQKLAVLWALREHPGVTSLELANLKGLDRYTVSRRLPDLLADGLVRKGPMRTCTVAKRIALTWFTTEG